MGRVFSYIFAYQMGGGVDKIKNKYSLFSANNIIYLQQNVNKKHGPFI